MTRRCVVGVVLVLGVMLPSGVRAVEPAEGCQWEGRGEGWRCAPPRHLALGVTLLKEYGFGGAVRGRLNHVGFEAAGGYVPYFVFGGDIDFRYFTTGQANGALLVYFSGHDRPLQHGIKLGYSFNSLTHSGVFAGYMAEISNRERFGWSFGAGLQYFFGAEERIEDRLRRDAEPGESFDADGIAALQFYMGVTLHYYLL